ncbi:MAG: rhomboid family intramembrane serine protease [Bacteroidales bacterium]
MDDAVREKHKFIRSLIFPAFFLVLIWAVKLMEIVFDGSVSFLGIYPRELQGLPGILFSPFIHGDLEHLSANSFSVFVLMASLFFFYRKIAFKVLILIWLFTGIWVWVSAREAYHIGASGLIYGLAAFLFVSGIIRKNPRLMAITLLVAFLYGSLIWGLFPELFPEKNISWESHLLGLIAGGVLAIYYRKEGPQRKLYSWDFEDGDEDGDDDRNAYWKATDTTRH